jgi:hypothetical protein
MSEQEYVDGSLAYQMRQDLRVDDSYGTHGDFQLVGHGQVTNANCGKFKAFWGCLRTELHQKRFKGDADYDPHDSKRVYMRKVFHSCDKASCPVCYKRGWAVREATRAEGRLEKAAERFGKVEHIAASIPPKLWGLSYEDLRARTLKALYARGIIGGMLIFHGFRFDRDASLKWFWSPHYHVLGFIVGGYGRCRSCRQQFCSSCEGYEGRTRRLQETDGFIVKVLGERKSVGATAYYQLNHATLRVGHGNHVATWFGCCSYRKLKVTVEKKKSLCPWCQHDLEELRYYGSKRFVLDRDSPLLERESSEDLEEDGRVVWVVVSKGRFGREE